MASPRKRFGQHFLEPAWVAKLVTALQPARGDRFLEIGPGRGAITVPLAARVERLLAIEVDRDLAAALSARALPNVEVVTADVLEADLPALAAALVADVPAGAAPAQVRVAGNLPYNISSPILFRLLDASASGLFADAMLMLQKEVADRLVAEPGTADYGVLTVCAQLGADITRVLALPPGAFRPPPKVRSAVVRLAFRPPPPEVHDRALVVAIVRSVFTQRRKMLSNALAPLAATHGVEATAVLTAAGIDPRQRPEALTLADYARVADALTSLKR